MNVSVPTAQLAGFHDIFAHTVHDDTRHPLQHQLHGRVPLIMLHSRVDLINQLNRFDSDSADEVEDALGRFGLSLRPNETLPQLFSERTFDGAYKAPAEVMFLEIHRVRVTFRHHVVLNKLLDRWPALIVDHFLGDIATITSMITEVSPHTGSLINEQTAVKLQEHARTWTDLSAHS